MTRALVWLRRDLRTRDNPALAFAAENHETLIPLYILDRGELGGAQGWWLHHSLKALQDDLKKCGLGLCLREGDALSVLEALIAEYQIEAVYWNRCYEPEAIVRDKRIKSNLQAQGLEVQSFNGSLLNEPWTILNQQQSCYKVFTAFWRQALQSLIIPPESFLNTENTIYPEPQSDNPDHWQLLPTSPDWAREFSQFWLPGESGALKNLERFIEEDLQGYKEDRNIPAIAATSHLSPHLHFGEISPWQIWRAIAEVKKDPLANLASIEHFLSELGWREFSQYLLFHFPKLPSNNFKPQFDAFPWSENADLLKSWQRGLTGYPIVDAGMRELWRTGFMHNRVRMITASFLVKDLFIDWRIGARWFLHTLLDADLANNSAGWQWVAGCGADAAPYFRIFNPVLQGEKFDPLGEYVKRWVPELAKVPAAWIHKPWEAPKGLLDIRLGEDYPYPVVDHTVARQYALESYKAL